MSKKRRHDGEGERLAPLLRAIVAGDSATASRLLAASPELARASTPVGASRQTSTPYFFKEIAHYVYAGDTALHVAAAAYRADIAKELVANGAKPGARNRRGAEPLHYATDGRPGSASWNPHAQAAIVEYLIGAGSDPNSADKSGVTPLHRAVRTRCAAAVRVLLARGARLDCKNNHGSTPLHLAVQNTGRGGSGDPEAREQQAEIIALLLQYGARPTDKDDRGKTVAECIARGGIEELLRPGRTPRR
jgi:ankyrin repeat protein